MIAANTDPSTINNVNLATGVILIVDDNQNNLKVLSEALTDIECEILLAEDGESAIEQILDAPPDLILLDIMMPGIDGFETCSRLKANPLTQYIPIIFMTALSDTKDKVKGFNLGAVDYITKPFEQEEVIVRVTTHLKLHNLTRQMQMQNQLLRKEVTERSYAEFKLQKLTQELEQRVEERTVRLSQALHDLHQSQLSLIQQEKMSALGQLVAGIAHEINNPVNFISGSLNHTSEHIQNLLSLLQLYQECYSNPLPEVHRKMEDIELEYLVDDLPKIISSMSKASDRINQIICSLRHFSRRDDSRPQPIDIHEAIDSTLLILQHRLQGNEQRSAIQVIKEYGVIQLVECYAGPLNQVFMNILVNAIDAIEESFINSPSSLVNNQREKTKNVGQIRIHTQLIENHTLLIKIIDNGLGMTQAVKERIFESMFTTKPVGKGTGLGLSISRQIVEEQHGGRLQCVSELGQGTVFWIEIPVKPS
jgi:signal transduction histidine kinase